MVLRKVLRWSGTGWYCPLNEEHKGMYWIPSKQGDRIGGYYYCASQEHSFVYATREATKNIWKESEIDALRAEMEKEAETPELGLDTSEEVS
jgi:hypothetical protein